MKRLELENFGVQELDAKEMKETDGGLVLGIHRWLIEGLGAVGGAMSDFAHAFKDGFQKGAQ